MRGTVTLFGGGSSGLPPHPPSWPLELSTWGRSSTVEPVALDHETLVRHQTPLP